MPLIDVVMPNSFFTRSKASWYGIFSSNSQRSSVSCCSAVSLFHFESGLNLRISQPSRYLKIKRTHNLDLLRVFYVFMTHRPAHHTHAVGQMLSKSNFTFRCAKTLFR